MKQTKRGISLIVLVITIIVMIILASAIILTLTSNDTIGRANEAKMKSDIANAKHLATVAKSEWELMSEDERRATGGDYSSYVTNKLTSKGIDVGPDGVVTVSSNGNINTVYVDEDGKRAIIPYGFTVSEDEEEDTITEGLVVIDKYDNEFVWVPVDGTNVKLELDSEFETETGTITTTAHGTEPGIVSRRDNNATNKDAILEIGYATVIDQLTAEYNKMVASVNANGGFYVGRYETSWDTEKVASISNVAPMRASTALESSWTTSAGGNSATWYGFYVKQKELYNKESDSVVSGMIYGCQWDAIMNWMLQGTDEEKLFVTDSTGKGHYPGYSSAKTINTGSKDEYAFKNIYDLGGNVAEFTQEVATEYARFIRGGRYDKIEQAKAAHRGTVSVDTVGAYGSRLQLYIK